MSTGAGWGPPPWVAWAPPQPRRSAWPIVLAGLGGVVVGGALTVLVLIALAAVSFTAAEDWLEDQLSEEYDSTSVAADAELGACFARQDLTATESPEVNCEEAHGVEVYARRPALDGENAPYPAELDSLGDGICLGEFEPFVSRSYPESSLEYVTLVPSQEAWNRGEHDIVCGLFAIGGDDLVGTSKGSGR